ncbi:MAG: FAD-binding domain-containing protein [Bacteriovoracaceae bacterium]
MHDIALIFYSFSLIESFYKKKAKKVVLCLIPFSIKDNPFQMITSPFEEYKNKAISDYANGYDVLTKEEEVLRIVKNKQVLADCPIGHYENQFISKLEKVCSLDLKHHENYLLNESHVSKLKGRFGFSKFRSHTESIFKKRFDFIENTALVDFKGFLSQGHALNYFDTRNQLLGNNFSTRLSHLLNIGLIRSKDVIQLVSDYEKKNHANKSTYWIKFELLWREYFYWLYIKNSEVFFRSKGFDGGTLKLDDLSENEYLKKMNTNPLIRAMNKELVETGFLSNRSRQIYASYLVNCIDLDWRYGAWFFQMHLKDYDLFSNWGNWLYLSGFGTDSRGPRFFNIVKQMKSYDPDLDYLKKWNEYSSNAWKEIDNSHL